MALVEYITLAAWGLLETMLRVREHRGGRGGTATDHGTRVLIGVSLAAALALAGVLGSHGARPLPGSRAVGIACIWVGVALRLKAILTLGDSFRTSVEVHQGQQVIDCGPYRWVRHPSYTGLMLIILGVGAAVGTWLSVLVATLVPLPALLYRISVEEALLVATLGEPYARYRSRTKRLIPGVW
ncbi:MAG TPA: isoprenylcysteine carboxylmethyltransferase family protein [Solirubrobacteraceae bacterium]|jgi:protein-S-isoprenylcysteine O-methyltransferase Ste14|nr:isoprenylcysteine carboxylmethyltransferase family protein [Solirubrobacteraceae bacterium]